MATLLLAESGSTKTDWCLLLSDGVTIPFKTSGINPHLQSPEQIQALLKEELTPDQEQYYPERIIFYGAGISGSVQQEAVRKSLREFFGCREVAVHSDMLAAARALCGDKSGIVCILGTGSNSCYYDGNSIREQQISLGYIAGDEGSGSYMGKRVLQYYAYHTFDEELVLAFEQLFGQDIHAIIHAMYAAPFPNRYLATFVKLLQTNRGHFMVENIIEDCLNDFFHYHILKYRESWKLPLYFSGSVAWGFSDAIETLCSQYELELGAILKAPMENLIRYHRKEASF